MGAYYNKLDKRFLAIAGTIAIIAVGSIAYFIMSPATTTRPPNSAPSDAREVKKPIANVTESKKEGLDFNPTVPKSESIIYIRSIYDHPYLVKAVGGVAFSATPFNSTSDIVVNLPGGAGVTLKQCIHSLPSVADPTSCPKGKTYTTNSTGWASIYPVANTKYYLLIRQTLSEGTYAIAEVRANQTTYATITVPIPGPRHGVVDDGGISLPKGFLSVEPLTWPLSHLTVLNGTSASFIFALAPSKECLQKAEVCSDLDFPLRADLSSSSLGIKPLVYSYATNSKLRTVWEKEALPRNDTHHNLTDATITISPNPIFLERSDRINVTVTITTKGTASYGLYHVSIGARVRSASGNLSGSALYWTMPYDLQFYLTINPILVQAGKNYYFDKEGSSMVVPFIRNSTLLKDNVWLRLNHDGTLAAGSDSGERQIGWWEIISNEIFFTLPNMTFQGRIIENAGAPEGSSIVLDDGSVWKVRKDG